MCYFSLARRFPGFCETVSFLSLRMKTWTLPCAQLPVVKQCLHIIPCASWRSSCLRLLAEKLRYLTLRTFHTFSRFSTVWAIKVAIILLQDWQIDSGSTCACTRTCTHTFTCTCTRTHTCTNAHAHTHSHAHAHTTRPQPPSGNHQNQATTTKPPPPSGHHHHQTTTAKPLTITNTIISYTWLCCTSRRH